MTTAAIIVAAGSGQRAGGGIPKQWRPLAGKRVIDWTIGKFYQCPDVDRIVVVVSPEALADPDALNLAPDLILTEGGDNRAASVRNGLAALDPPPQNVLIHDAARPCVSADLISDIVHSLRTQIAAAPALPITDALWTGRDGEVTGMQDRAGLFAAQTPQGFRFDAICDAHAKFTGAAADDVEVVRAAGLSVAIVPGEPDNIKITTPADFARAERILGDRLDIRTGNGFDVHKFGPGDAVTLCGVQIPHGQSLVGHSDADVGMHAVSDAIYGALAMGDIGQHFPPSDPQWKGAASDIFLRHAADLASQNGFTITHLDCTLICEMPKIGPHASAMRAALSDITGVEQSRISVKATTSEQLGFTGRREGIAAMATATLVAS